MIKKTQHRLFLGHPARAHLSGHRIFKRFWVRFCNVCIALYVNIVCSQEKWGKSEILGSRTSRGRISKLEFRMENYFIGRLKKCVVSKSKVFQEKLSYENLALEPNLLTFIKWRSNHTFKILTKDSNKYYTILVYRKKSLLVE